MDRQLFSSLLSKRMYPHLRAQGYRGSGTTLRRIEEPVVQVFNVQASSGGDRCYFNLGVHLTFLPAEGGQLVAPSELKESHCAFRSRIDPPAGQQFGWAYGSNAKEAEANVDRALVEWERQARPFFEEHSYPIGLTRLLANLSLAEFSSSHLLTFARVALHLNQRERAMSLAESALERANPSTSGLRHSINAFLSQSAT
jgi:Domain of unknown function (DUF4304)